MARKRKKPPKDFKHSPEIEQGLDVQVPDQIPKHTELSKKMKLNVLTQFNKSKALTILVTMFNMEMMENLLPYNYRKVMEGEDEDAKEKMHNRVLSILMGNYRFALNWISKVIPKEVGIFGSLDHQHSLAAKSKRAFTTPKPNKVIDMVKGRRDKEFYSATDQEVEDEVDRELDDYYQK